MKVLLEWSFHPKELVRNVHNDRHSVRLQDAYGASFCDYYISYKETVVFHMLYLGHKKTIFEN